MRIITRYIAGSFLLTFFLSFTVLTCVLSLGVIFKITEVISSGMSWRPVMIMFFSGMPSAIKFTIPMSALISALLVFGRLSSDMEIMAMRAGGLSMSQIMTGPVAVALIITMLSLANNLFLAPRSHYARRTVQANIRSSDMITLLEEGRYVSGVGDFSLHIGRRKDKTLWDIRILDRREGETPRDITARSGQVLPKTDHGVAMLELYDVRINPFDPERPGAGYADRWMISLGSALRKREYKPNEDDLILGELLEAIKDPRIVFEDLPVERLAEKRGALRFALHSNFALAFLSLAFVLVGIPLGIQTHRRESTAGVAMALGITMLSYLFIIASESATKSEMPRAELIVWLPVLLCAELSLRLTRR